MITTRIDQVCANNPGSEAVGVCEICRKAFCKACSADLDFQDEDIQKKLRLLMLGSLPHIVCGGCFGLLTFLFGDRLEGVFEKTDVSEILEKVYKQINYLRLNPNRVEHYSSVLMVVRETVVPIF